MPDDDGRSVAGPRPEHHCKACRYWYGAEDDEYGPCQLKQARGERRFVTFGEHVCDEPVARKEYGVDP